MVIENFIHACFVFFSLADYQSITIAVAVCFSLILAVILKCMHVGGYILQKKTLPDTLVRNFHINLPGSSWKLAI